MIKNLKAQVESLQSVVSTLTTQINFLLSFVGAVESNYPVNSVNLSVANAPTVSVTDYCPTVVSSNSNINGVSSVDKPNELPAFSDIVRQATISDFPRRTTNIRETAVAAVYVDKAEAERRASSFIISGLPLTNSSSDRDLVSHLCLNGFGICPEIAFTKRLGRPVADKVQPLLVYVKQTDQAKFIVSAAINFVSLMILILKTIFTSMRISPRLLLVLRMNYVVVVDRLPTDTQLVDRIELLSLTRFQHLKNRQSYQEQLLLQIILRNSYNCLTNLRCQFQSQQLLCQLQLQHTLIDSISTLCQMFLYLVDLNMVSYEITCEITCLI